MSSQTQLLGRRPALFKGSSRVKNGNRSSSLEEPFLLNEEIHNSTQHSETQRAGEVAGHGGGGGGASSPANTQGVDGEKDESSKKKKKNKKKRQEEEARLLEIRRKEEELAKQEKESRSKEEDELISQSLLERQKKEEVERQEMEKAHQLFMARLEKRPIEASETLPISTDSEIYPEKDDPIFVTSEGVDGLQRGGASGSVQRHCIFKLDEHFELFPRAPNSISIGPIHHETLKLKPMQLAKEKLASEFRDRVGEIIVGDFRNFLIVNEARIRGSYAYDTSRIALEKLIAIILCDATFFIELIYKSIGVGDFQYDFFENNIEKEEVKNELMFLENQIPLFIHFYFFLNNQYIKPRRQTGLKRPHNHTSSSTNKCGINIDQFIELFYKLFDMTDSIGIGLKNCTLDLRTEVLHLLDLRRLMETGWVKENKTTTKHVQVESATVLTKYGFKFQPIKQTMYSLSKSYITCLPHFEMPRFYMDVGWELRILNMMAFEILYFGDTKKMPLCQYMHLLNCLVQNFEDMRLLMNRKVIIVVSSDKDQVYEKLKDIGRRMKISIHPAICEELDKVGDDCHLCKAEFRTIFCSCETIKQLVPGVLLAGTLGAIQHVPLDWLLNR